VALPEVDLMMTQNTLRAFPPVAVPEATVPLRAEVAAPTPDAWVALRSKTVAWSRPWLRVALFALVLSASTGVLLRFGLTQGMPAWATNYGAVRHAHSHLMYFGWGTLGIMALIWGLLPLQTARPRPRWAGAQLALTALLSLLSFPAFWANGYGETEIFGRSLPLGSMAAAINGLPWFLFLALYLVATWKLPVRSLAVQLWDWALVLLMLASAGAMALGVQVALNVESSVLRNASLHIFLDLFATGWFTLAMLGLLWAWLGTPARATGMEGSVGAQPAAWLPTMAVALPLVMTFVLGMSPAAVSPAAFWVAVLANLVAALLLAGHLRALLAQRRGLPRLALFGLAFFTIYLLTAVVVLVPGIWRVAVGGQLRVFYLHNLLLGFMSSILLGMVLQVVRGVRAPRAGRDWPTWAVEWLWMVGVGVMIFALLGLGMTRWISISAILWLRLAAWSSLLPATAAVLAMLLPARQAEDQWAGAHRPDVRGA
jgi:hypothetical protein